ncbi:phytanoyl-CoA dioxygenase family protein [Terrabacter terrae]|uniref:Phytanoyl-CoA dioxygenase family protein n=1 Tax=Terrabacter terrae TaxID=318434 RepID=A0ABN2TQW2_9MICO
MTSTIAPHLDHDLGDALGHDVDALHRDGIVAHPGAFPRDWVDELHRDVLTAYREARTRERGAITRGPHRWHVQIHPEQLGGFVTLATHPWVTALCETVLGPGYVLVEIGFDIPFAGAVDQPWHRDFPSPPETHRHGRLTSLAFNLTTVDTALDMGPFEIAPGTQYEPGLDWAHGMFPPRSTWGRYQRLAERRMPQRGDISARSALAVHRGTANRTSRARPVVVLGTVAPSARHEEHPRMTVTREFWMAIPQRLRDHLEVELVDELTPLEQEHDIEGPVMGIAP